MKQKRLAFMIMTMLAAGSARAYNLYDNQETGTALDFVGSARVRWSSEGSKEIDYNDNGRITKYYVNRPVSNDGSRFGFRVNQRLYEDFYALGRVEWRFRGRDNAGVKTSSQHDFDHLYTRQLYAGVGHNKYGELTYGNQTVITDEVKQTDLANTLSLSDGLLVSGARRSVQYVYQGIEGLKLGAFYGGKSPRANNGLALEGHRIDSYGGAAIYKHKLNEDQEFVIATGITKERYRQSGTELDSNGAITFNYPSSYSETAYALDLAYTYDDTTFGLDLERRITKDEENISKKKEREIRAVIYHKLTQQWRAYGMYANKKEERDYAASSDREYKTNEFMLGTEYRIPLFTDLSLRTFIEWKTARTKQYRNGEKREKVRDNQTVIGLRLYW